MRSSNLGVCVIVAGIMSVVLSTTRTVFALLILRRIRSQNLGADSDRMNVVDDMRYTLKITLLLQYASAVCFFLGLVIFLSMRYETAIAIVLSIVGLIGVYYVMVLPPSHHQRPSSAMLSLLEWLHLI